MSLSWSVGHSAGHSLVCVHSIQCISNTEKYAKMASFSGVKSSCPVCSKDYTETGENVAKLLPCTHTVCGYCAENKLFQYFERSLTCPVCEKEHHFFDGVESVSVNQYVRAMVRKGQEGLCHAHKMDLSLFCEEPECQTPICALCLKNEHKGHDFDGLQKSKEKRSKMLLEEIKSLRISCTSNKDKIEILKRDTELKFCARKEKIRLAREEVIKEVHEHFNKMETDEKEKSKKQDDIINDTSAKFHGYLKEIQRMEETIEEIECKSFSNKLNEVKKVKKEITDLMSQLYECQDSEFREREPLATNLKDICRNLIQEDSQSDANHPEGTNISEEHSDPVESPKPKRKRENNASEIKNAAKFECEGKNTRAFVMVYKFHWSYFPFHRT